MKEKPFLDIPNKAHLELLKISTKGMGEFSEDEVLIFKNWIWDYFENPPNKTTDAFEELATEINTFNNIKSGGISAKSLKIIIYPEKKQEKFPQKKQVRLTNIIVSFFNAKFVDSTTKNISLTSQVLSKQHPDLKSTIPEPIVNNYQLSNQPSNLEFITPHTFDNEIFKDQSLVNDYVFDYYLRFNNDLLIISAGYDDNLIARVSSNKSKIKKRYYILGLPSLRPDMYQENILKMYQAKDSIGQRSDDRYAPAFDPFVTAQVISDIVEENRNHSNIYLSPLSTKPQALGIILYYLWNFEKKSINIIFPYSNTYQPKSATGIKKTWKYTFELPL